jgi:hypothetical protein
VFEVFDPRAAVHPGVVAAGGLHGGRELEQPVVARFHLRLHQEVQDAVDLLGQNAEQADLRLHDDRLLPVLSVVVHPHALDAEEPAGVVREVAGARFHGPAVHLGEGDPAHLEAVRPAASGEPRREVLGAQAGPGGDRGQGPGESLRQAGVRAGGQRRGGHRTLHSQAARPSRYSP